MSGKKNKIPNPPPLTKERLVKYTKNRMLFRLEQLVLEPSLEYPQGVLFADVCQDWQIEYIYKPIDATTSDGLPVYRLLYIQLPKKFGKTSLIAGECLARLILTPYPSKDNYLLAGDKEQAAYLLDMVKGFIDRNVRLKDMFDIYRNEIRVPSTGAKLTVLSSEASTKQGRNVDFFVFDEFWNQEKRDLWDSMWLGMAARPRGQGIIITNAGYDKKTICYEIKKLCESERNKNFYHFAPTGEILDSLSTPWITEEWLEIERATTPTNVWLRFRKNIWVSTDKESFMPDEGWSCFKTYMTEKESCLVSDHYIGLDLGLKKDAAALVVVHREGRRIIVDRLMRWLGSKDVPVDLMEIETSLANIINNFANCEIIADPWQAMGLIQKFRAAGLSVKEFYLTPENISKLSKNLYYLFKNCTIDIPSHNKLEEELKGLKVIQKTYGWRIDHSDNTSSDLTIALGMAALTAMERGIHELGTQELSGLFFLDHESIYKAGGKREFTGLVNKPAELFEEEIPRIKNTKRLF